MGSCVKVVESVIALLRDRSERLAERVPEIRDATV